MRLLSVVEAQVAPGREFELQTEFTAAASEALPAGLARSELLRDSRDPTRWRIQSLWVDRGTLEGTRAAGTPACVRMFRAADAKPALATYELVDSISEARPLSAPPPPSLETERLVLEPLIPAHAAELFPVLSDPRVYQFMMGQGPPSSLEGMERVFERTSRHLSPDGRHVWHAWVLRAKDGGVCMGRVEATLIPDGSAYLAYLLGADFWGQGFMSEACRRTVDALFQDYGVERITGEVDTRNTASIRILERLGFEKTTSFLLAGVSYINYSCGAREPHPDAPSTSERHLFLRSAPSSRRMLLTTLEAQVAPEQEDALQAAYAAARSEALPSGLFRSELLRDVHGPAHWRIQTLWESREALGAMRARGTPAGVLMFRAADAEPVLSIHDVVDDTSQAPRSSPAPLTALETERLVLEPLTSSHAAELFPLLSDRDVFEFMALDPPTSLEALEAAYERFEGRLSPDGRQIWLDWAIRAKEQGDCVGRVEAILAADGSAYLTCTLGLEQRGRGFASEACRRVIEALFRDHDAVCVAAEVDERNAASIRLLDGLGFRKQAAVGRWITYTLPA